MVRRKVQPRSINSVADVIIPLRNKYNDSLLNKALHIFTPFSGKKSLPTLSGLTPEAKEFIFKYEPRAITDGLFSHQYELLDAYNRGAEHFILTSSTGSGKSLCFWTWIMDVLARDRSATALVCFPTQALIWGQAERLARISEHDSLKIYDQKKKLLTAGKLD